MTLTECKSTRAAQFDEPIIAAMDAANDDCLYCGGPRDWQIIDGQASCRACYTKVKSFDPFKETAPCR